MSVSDVLEISRQGIFAHGRAVQTTSHNISNVNTPGFSRQQVKLEARPYIRFGQTYLGGGVEVRDVTRVHDTFVNKQIYAESMKNGTFKTKADVLQQVEGMVLNSGKGIGQLLTNFFSDVRELSMNPETPTMRFAVKESAEAVAQGFNKMSSSMSSLQKEMQLRLDGTLDEANGMLQRLANLNSQISSLENVGQYPAELHDNRDLLLNELSYKLGLEATTDRRGQINLVIPGVGLAIQGDEPVQFYSIRTPGEQGKGEGVADVMVQEPHSKTPHKMTRSFQQGELAGMLQARDEVLNKAASHLDEIAFRFIERINSLHQQGTAVDDVGNAPFFEPLSGKSGAAEFMKVSSEIKKNPEAIVSALELGLPGDNRVALDMAAIEDEQLVKDMHTDHLDAEARYTIGDAFNNLIGNVAESVKKTQLLTQQQEDLMGQLENYRQSISGVNLEEEAINLMQYQTAFNAAAKTLRMGDEMLETILSLKR